MIVLGKTLLACILLSCLLIGCANTQAGEQNIFTGAATGSIDDIPSDSYLEPSLQTGIGYSSGSGRRIANLFSIGMLFDSPDNAKHVTDSRDRFDNDEHYLKACWFAAHRARQQAIVYNNKSKRIIAQHVSWAKSRHYSSAKLNMPPATQKKENDTLANLIAQQNINRKEIKNQIAKYMTASIKGSGASKKTKHLLEREIQLMKQAAETLETQTWDLQSLQQLLRTENYINVLSRDRSQEKNIEIQSLLTNNKKIRNHK